MILCSRWFPRDLTNCSDLCYRTPRYPLRSARPRMISSSFPRRLRTPFVRSRCNGAFRESTFVHPVDRRWRHPGVDLGRGRRVALAFGGAATDVRGRVTPDFPDSLTRRRPTVSPTFFCLTTCKARCSDACPRLRASQGLSFRAADLRRDGAGVYRRCATLNRLGGLFMDAGNNLYVVEDRRQPGTEVQCRGQ